MPIPPQFLKKAAASGGADNDSPSEARAEARMETKNPSMGEVELGKDKGGPKHMAPGKAAAIARRLKGKKG